VFNWSLLKVPTILRLYFIFKLINFVTQFYLFSSSFSNEVNDNDFSFNFTLISFDQLLLYDEYYDETKKYFFYTLFLYLTNNIISIFSVTSALSFLFYNMAILLRKWLYPQLQLVNNNIDVDNDLLDIGEITTVLFLILSVQSSITQLYGIDRLKKLIKNMLLLIIALLHFLHRILDQQLMQLSATTSYKQIKKKDNESDIQSIILKKRHFRNLILSVSLIVIPVFLLIILWINCKVSTWLLAATCFNLELFIKMTVSLVIYTLFIIDSKRLKSIQNENGQQQQQLLWENFDDYIYYIKSFGRIFEFLVAIFLFFNSLYILLFESYGSIR
jgi:hypothetical protein